nr:RES family NAD+ phosphorylase [uncultured Cupriavidus sp.]
MKTAWRISKEAEEYAADDSSGTGASRDGGRWNRKGVPVTYCAESISLACLETLIRLRPNDLLMNRYLSRVDIPDELWCQAIHFSEATAPVGWDAVPHGKTSLDLGDQWIAELRSAILIVPSSIIPEEPNVLINPSHADAKKITFRKIRKWIYDPRLLRRLLFT